MCGICAVSRAPKSSIPNINLFMRHASYTIEKRGPHATGFGWFDKNGKSWYQKAPGKATEVAHEFDLSGARVAIGHTRYATQGKPEINENNHPILEENITLVHNGIVDNDWWVFRQLDDYKRTNEVDSQAIACLLAYPEEFGSKGPADVLEDNFEGDAALAWLDGETPGTLHLARCNGRPMFIGHTKRGDLIMASTDEALIMLSRMSGVNIFDIEEVPEGTYMQVVDGEITHMESFIPYVSWKKYMTPAKKTGTGAKIGTPSSSSKTSSLSKPYDVDSDDDDKPSLTVVQEHEWDWDDKDEPKSLALSDIDSWSFLDWDDEQTERELWVKWGCDKETFSDVKHYESVKENFINYLIEQAELEDMLANHAIMAVGEEPEVMA